MWVLFKLGLTIFASDDEVIAFCLDIAGGKVPKGEDVVNWIAEHVREIDAQ